MTEPRHRPDPAPDAGPTPVTRGLVTLALRLALGMALLDAGIVHHLQAKFGGPGGFPTSGRFRFMGVPPWMMSPPSITGWDEYARYFPYVEVGIGVALVLGFFTTAAAVAAAFWPLVAHAVKVAFVLAVLGPADPNTLQVLTLGDLTQGGTLGVLLAASALIWVASWGNNPLSLDALIRRRHEDDVALGSPTPHHDPGRVTAGSIPDVPAVGSVSPIGREFDAGLFVEEVGAGDEAR